MNERIQELAYQAEDYADGIVDQGGEFHLAYTQKLAELIVQECVGRVWYCIQNDLDYIAEDIEQHFRVSE